MELKTIASQLLYFVGQAYYQSGLHSVLHNFVAWLQAIWVFESLDLGGNASSSAMLVVGTMYILVYLCIFETKLKKLCATLS